jgi:TonB family protein
VALLVGFVSLLAASCGQNTDEKSEEIAAVADKTVSIEGTITSAEGIPLPGASIVVKGTQTGTTTTSQGEFMLTAPADSELDFSFIGHKKASLKMAGQGTVQVSLAEENDSENSTAQKVSSDIGIIKVAHRAEKQTVSNYAKDSVFTVVRTQPKFPGGIKAMYKFIDDNIKYPASARKANVSGKVFLIFVVNADGTIENIQVLKGLGFGLDEEAIRIMKQTPKWMPGAKDDGEKVKVKYNLPISFVLPEGKKEIGRAVLVEKDLPMVTVVRKTDSNAKVDSLNGLNHHLPRNGEDFDKNSEGNLRGGGFIGNQPLYVVDGVVSSFSEISPNDIETIEVLKGEKATKLYGLRGTNGVLLVTTKQGDKKQQQNIEK